MTMKSENIFSPILFNAWKHHWKYIQKQIEKFKQIEDLNNQIKVIGHSVLDLYIGELSIENISEEIISILQKKDFFEEYKYLNWLKNNHHYQEIELSDGSIWTLLKGNEVNKYIHIHPSRYSPFSIRSNANSLKTAILSLYYKNKNEVKISLEIINMIRYSYLLLSPIKTIKDARKILDLIELRQNF
ncbi:MAG: hypothetical protein MUC49_03715 [Raineya sp.]|nr:hypothetical protein [Raineya sp.]